MYLIIFYLNQIFRIIFSVNDTAQDISDRGSSIFSYQLQISIIKKIMQIPIFSFCNAQFYYGIIHYNNKMIHVCVCMYICIYIHSHTHTQCYIYMYIYKHQIFLLHLLHHLCPILFN